MYVVGIIIFWIIVIAHFINAQMKHREEDRQNRARWAREERERELERQRLAALPPRPEKPRPRYVCVECRAAMPRHLDRGDDPLRCAACAAEPARRGPAWRLSPAGVERVAKQFRLGIPLRVTIARGRHERSAYRGISITGLGTLSSPLVERHEIRLGADASAEEAGRILLHLACHASQREHRPEAMRAYREMAQRALMGLGSRRALAIIDAHALEREARAAEARAAQLRPVRERAPVG